VIIVIGHWRHERESIGSAAEEDDDERAAFVAVWGEIGGSAHR
jgi:hypothetical protein